MGQQGTSLGNRRRAKLCMCQGDVRDVRKENLRIGFNLKLIMEKFTIEEINLMCVFDRRSRTELIEEIDSVLLHLDDPASLVL